MAKSLVFRVAIRGNTYTQTYVSIRSEDGKPDIPIGVIRFSNEEWDSLVKDDIEVILEKGRRGDG